MLLRLLLALPLVIGTFLFVPQSAQAHVERPSYWPDPKPDCSVSPCAGGKVPKARTLASALDRTARGDTRVVCKDDSLLRVERSIDRALEDGYWIRPTDRRKLSTKKAARLLEINRKLFQRCTYRQIQPAVTASGNNDRVVVMPGLYKEPRSRKQPTFDPRCAPYKTKSDDGDPNALSHDYQFHCPNDANLIAVIGRGLDTGALPDSPHDDRHGIPNVGTCIRCNFQLEGSGVSADDVIVEAGSAKAGNGGPSAVGHKKDVGIFADRADGFVLRNVTVRHAREHDIYVTETDGFLLDRFKVYYAGGYGVLTFVGDHGVVQNCDAAGHGDSGLYPGSGADSTTNRYLPFYPKYRFSQVFRYCDSHHNTGGFSGTNSHGTLITRNNFYDNALGYTTDVFTAPGHPGFPQHGNVVTRNRFYSNNFNPFTEDSDVDPFIPAPVGTGLWLAGGNDNVIRQNWFYDNWRRGVMVFAVPDVTVCGPPPVTDGTPVPGCDPLGISTSFGNDIHHNKMGVKPNGTVKPNGLDFWWDAFPGNTGNCWWDNISAPGKKVTSSPGNLPNCAGGTNPASSIGLGDVLNEAELVACLAGFQLAYPDGVDLLCSWGQTPKKPTGGISLPIPLPIPSLPTSLRTTALSQQTQTEAFAAVCEAGLASRLCDAYGDELSDIDAPDSRFKVRSVKGIKPVFTEGRLSSFTCSWWRQADDAHRLGMVQRLRALTTGKVPGYGYGAGMSDARAMQLLEGRCTTFEAGSFALYKLYGAAAPFAAMAP